MTSHRLKAAQKLFAHGTHYARTGAHQEALAFYRAALDQKPEDAELFLNLGMMFEQLAQYGEAIECYRQALALDPSNHFVMYNTGNALQAIGRFDLAALAYRSAIRYAPMKGAYYGSLAQCMRLAADDPCLRAMEQFERDPSHPLDDRIHVCFGLGKAWTDLGEHERGFEYFLEGNRLHRGRISYREPVAIGELERIREAFTADLLRRAPKGDDVSPAPIFIMGMPRSGSTLVEQILASHPQVMGRGERNDFPDAIAEVFGQRDTGQPDAERPADAAPFQPQWLTQGLDDMPAERWRELGAQYLRRVRSALGNASTYQWVTDKMPFNFAYLGLISLALPNARFIHTRRAPVETCLSCFTRHFENVPFCYDLHELGRYYREYDRLMAHWREVLPEGMMLEVHYEDVVADVEQEARRLVAHVGLEWDDACLDFHNNTRTVVTASAAQVRQPIYRSSVERWRPRPEVIEPLLEGLGPELANAVGSNPRR